MAPLVSRYPQVIAFGLECAEGVGWDRRLSSAELDRSEPSAGGSKSIGAVSHSMQVRVFASVANVAPRRLSSRRSLCRVRSVPGAGFEPACPFGQWILNPSRKPVPPSGPQVKLSGTWFAGTTEPSSLGADEAIQETDALFLCNGQISSVVLPPVHSEAIACSAEQTANVLRCVGEVVTRIWRAIYPIENPATVGVNQASKKRRRAPINERLLPLSQADRALVLPTGTMLGEKARPMLRVRRHLRAPDTRDAANTVG
jgi:hypothetical protein